MLSTSTIELFVQDAQSAPVAFMVGIAAILPKLVIVVLVVYVIVEVSRLLSGFVDKPLDSVDS